MEDIEYVFVDPPSDGKLLCSICTNTLRDPRLTDCCGQHFCQKCLQSWLKKDMNKTCPHCREKDFAHILDKSVRREINQLKVRCWHHEEGCEWEGELGDLQTHLDSEEGCGYVEVKCPNTCIKDMVHDTYWGYRVSVTKVTRKDLTDHLRVCDLRTFTCEHCGRQDTYWNITGQSTCTDISLYYWSDNHYSKCPSFPLDCPNGCSLKVIKRWYMPAHREQCPLEPVQCPFQEAGCETRLVRKDLKQHLMAQTQQHLLMTFVKCSKLEQRCRELERRNTELEGGTRTL